MNYDLEIYKLWELLPLIIHSLNIALNQLHVPIANKGQNTMIIKNYDILLKVILANDNSVQTLFFFFSFHINVVQSISM